MYERNAIVIERYFNNMFGYNMRNNLKTIFRDYSELIEDLEKYKEVSDEEETVVQEYDSIANKIRDIQKHQVQLDEKNRRLQEERANIFKNIDENPDIMQKKIDNLNNSIQDLNEQIGVNAQQFVQSITEFNEKTTIRTTCERNRRKVESEYNKKLNQILDNYSDIDINFVKKAKFFLEAETDDIESELKDKVQKNGEKERVPFNEEVITKAITLSVDIQKRETDILANIYDKMSRLFTEIKNNSVKIDKHKKNIKDSKSKLEFLNAIKEYLIQFLDNERVTAVNGETEHTKLMEEACKNIDEDLLQINNLYTLLLKEISKKITKKSYSELYNIDYLNTLEDKSIQFDEEVKKLNLPVTIINPNYWRIEGMKKIYDLFFECVTEQYGRDLSQFIVNKDDEVDEEYEAYEVEEKNVKNEEENSPKIDEEHNKSEEKKSEDTQSEIDRKIDMILGFDEDEQIRSQQIVDDKLYDQEWNEDIEEDDDDWDDIDYEENEDTVDEDDKDDDDWEEEIDNDWDKDNMDKDDEWNGDEEDEEDEDDWDDDWDDELIEEDESKDDLDKDDKKINQEDESVNIDIWGNNIKSKKEKKSVSKGKKRKETKQDTQKKEENWGDEYIRLDSEDKNKKGKKKKGFFEKFKK